MPGYLQQTRLVEVVANRTAKGKSLQLTKVGG
jgi:hypothetical protein